MSIFIRQTNPLPPIITMETVYFQGGMRMTHKCTQLHVLSFGLALGVTWGLGIFILGIVNYFSIWGVEVLGSLATLYIGYAPTILGSVLGAIWGFVDAFIGGVIIAWLYNKFSHCCSNTCAKSEE